MLTMTSANEAVNGAQTRRDLWMGSENQGWEIAEKALGGDND